jgi:hypothetical protein
MSTSDVKDPLDAANAALKLLSHLSGRDQWRLDADLRQV